MPGPEVAARTERSDCTAQPRRLEAGSPRCQRLAVRRDHLLTVSSWGLSSVWASLVPLLPTSHTGSAPPCGLIHFHYLVKGLVSKCSRIRGWGFNI